MIMKLFMVLNYGQSVKMIYHLKDTCAHALLIQARIQAVAHAARAEILDLPLPLRDYVASRAWILPFLQLIAFNFPVR